jgi:hypothetical protein
MPRGLQKNYISGKVVRGNNAESWNLMKRFVVVGICYEDGITNSNILRKIMWLNFVTNTCEMGMNTTVTYRNTPLCNDLTQN